MKKTKSLFSKDLRNKSWQGIALILGVLTMSILVGYLAFAAWTPPFQAPPGGNVSEPINAGTDHQIKAGGLGISGGFFVDSPTLVIDAVNDRVGIGTTEPSAKLDINDGGAASGTRFLEIGDDIFLTDIDVANFLGIYGQQNSDRAGIRLGSNGSYIFGDNGNVGIGTTNPGAKLEVAGGQIKITGGSPGLGKVLTSDASGLASWQTIDGGVTCADCDGRFVNVIGDTMTGLLTINALGFDGGDLQLRLKRGASIYYDFAVDSDGVLAIKDEGNNVRLKIDDGGNVIVSKDLFVNGGISTYDTIVLDNTVESGKFCLGNGVNCITSWPTGGGGDITGVYAGTNLTGGGTSGEVTLATVIDPTFHTVYTDNWFRSTGKSGWYSQTYGGGWYMTDSSYIRNYGSKRVYLNNNLYAPIMYDFNNTSYYVDPASTSKFNKITANEIDPIYNIEGKSYATYGHSTIGLKEEVMGKVELGLNPEEESYDYVIDFDEQEEGSDLWLFREITAFGEDWEDLVVVLTPEGKAWVWYELVPEENLLIIYGDEPVKVSYRFVAPRFDWPERDTNFASEEDQGTGLKVK